MQTRKNNFYFGGDFNFATDNLFIFKTEGISSFPPVEGNFELLNNTPFLLLNGTNLLLL